MQQRWQTIHWQQTTQQSGSDAIVAKVDRLLEFIAPCIRLEPQLLREVRLLTRGLQSNPELESLVWQHPIISSQHSVAGVVNESTRKVLLSQFEFLDADVRRTVLNLMLQTRQAAHPAIHFEEIMSLDEVSRNLVDQQLIEIAEEYFTSLADSEAAELNFRTTAWIARCDHRLPTTHRLSTRFQFAMQKLVMKTLSSSAVPVSGWMTGSLSTADDARAEIQIRQRGGNYLMQVVRNTTSDTTNNSAIAASPIGSLIGTLRCSEPVVWIHEHELVESKNSEASFWSSGKKPTWVDRFGADKYGAWCSFRVKDVEQILRWVPAGSFLMGSPDNEEGRDKDESPQHLVTISRGFWMFETPCTQELWAAVTGTNPSHFKGNRRPVESISWYQTQEFNNALKSILPGIDAKLPREAQWEYACLGADSQKGKQNSASPELNDSTWFSANSDGETQVVRQKSSNGFGLYDMLGNVQEWCSDDAYRPYSELAQIDPFFQSAVAGANRIVRGGSWHNSRKTVRPEYRSSQKPTYFYRTLGFRCLSSPEPGAEPNREAAMSGSESQQGGSPQDRERERPPRGKIFPGERQSVSPPSSQSVFLSKPDSLGASTPSRMLTLNGPARSASISLPRKPALQIETDCEVLSLELAAPPEWAVASGRDQYGLWAEFELTGVRQRLRWIPPGLFLMGSPKMEKGRYRGEGPQHSVTISCGFWIFDTPCTQLLWSRVMTDNPSETLGDEHPVCRVPYSAAVQFMNEVNGIIPGLNLTLPTEALWEYCCRSGDDADRYGPEHEISWFAENSEHQTHTVRLKRPNRWGLYDMLGNVYERCLDRHRAYDLQPQIDPVGSLAGTAEPVIRGGSWGSHTRRIRAAYRNKDHPIGRVDRVGFRCLSSPESIPEQDREAAKREGPSRRDGGPQDEEHEHQSSTSKRVKKKAAAKKNVGKKKRG